MEIQSEASIRRPTNSLSRRVSLLLDLFDTRGGGYLQLTLLSGGIRGIVQLTMLDALEKRIGLGIPIQDFFDLIVGTRYVARTRIRVVTSN